MDDLIEGFIKEALHEDWGRGDLFSLIAEDRVVEACVIAKSSGIFSGELYLKTLCKMRGLSLLEALRDTQAFEHGDILAKIKGSYLEILKVERVLLNILQHSSGIATHTYRFVQKLENLPISLLDTRKTRPLLRKLEKYSVRNGGGKNHRLGLDDALMLKDTHLLYVTDLCELIAQARKKLPFTCKIEVECESFEECIRAFEAGVDIVMCDNMEASEIKRVVQIRNEKYPLVLLEASGNLSLENIAEYASSGVDAVSCGSLIHQATWLDMSMKMENK